MLEASYYRTIEMADANFPIQILSRMYNETGLIVGMHWHEHMQVYLITQGNGVLYCNKASLSISKGDVLLVNSNELHLLESAGQLGFHIITIDFTFLFSNKVDACQTKYIAPICQNLILFRNDIGKNEKIASCIESLIAEYTDKLHGYELAVKAEGYHLIVLLLRDYVNKTISQKENDIRLSNLKRLQEIFTYIHQNYHQNIDVSQLSKMISVSNSHFCRLFRQISGKNVSDYINGLRVEEALVLLRESDMNITEVAFAIGFNDANYFSRIFKKYKKSSPTIIRKSL